MFNVVLVRRDGTQEVLDNAYTFLDACYEAIMQWDVYHTVTSVQDIRNMATRSEYNPETRRFTIVDNKVLEEVC